MRLLDRLFQYKHTNSKGVTYRLYTHKAILMGGKPHQIYYFAKKGINKGKPSRLPKDKYVNENPRNGFLTVKAKSEAEQSIK